MEFTQTKGTRRVSIANLLHEGLVRLCEERDTGGYAGLDCLGRSGERLLPDRILTGDFKDI